MERSYVVCALLILTVLLTGSCRRKSRYFLFSESESVPNEVAPKVVSISPERSAREVGLRVNVRVRFDRPIEPTSVTTDSFKVRSVAGPVPGTFRFRDVPSPTGTDVIFQPDFPLGVMAEYTVDLGRDLRDTTGNRLATEVVWSFQTRDGIFEGDESVDPAVELNARPTIAFDAYGGAIAIWNGFDGDQSAIFVRHLEPKGPWGDPLPLELPVDGSSSRPALVVTPGGSARAVWVRHDSDGTQTISASQYEPGEGWTTAQAIDASGEGDPNNPTLTASSDGRTRAAWVTSNPENERQEIQVRTFDSDAGWGELAVIRSSQEISRGPVITSSDSGVAVALWTEGVGEEIDLWGAVQSVANGWQPARRLDVGTEPPSIPDFAVDARGHVTVMWSQSDGELQSIWWTRWVPLTGWRDAQSFDQPETDSSRPRLAVEPDGTVTVVWQSLQAPPKPLGRILERRFHRSTGWGEIRVAAEEADHALHSPRFGLDGAGGAVVIFQLVSRQGWDDVCAVRRDPESGWGRIQALEHQNSDTRDVRIRVDARGNAVALWQRRSGNVWEPWASRFASNGGWRGEQALAGQSNRIVLDMNPSGLVGVVWLAQGQQGRSAQIRAHLFR